MVSLSAMPNDAQIQLNVKYTLTPIKTKISITVGIVLVFFAILGATDTTISWAYLVMIVIFAIIAVVFWYLVDSIIKKSQEYTELFNEIKNDIKFIKNNLEGNKNGSS